MTGKRKYTKRVRARKEEETRARIIDAALACWADDGPAATTISGVAARARVQRLTLYRHFPDENALAAACIEQFRATHPWPDPADWAAIGPPAKRLRRALRSLYTYYETCGPMLARVLYDGQGVPALRELLDHRQKYLDGVTATLEPGWTVRGKHQNRLRAALHHVVAFDTWRSLSAQGLSVREAARLMGRFLRSL